MPDSKMIWMDGKLVPYADAKIHVLSHSLHYGCAVFEGMRAYETTQGQSAVFRAKEHYQRFMDSIKVMGYPCKYSMEEFIEATRQVIKANDFKECYVRPLAYIDDTVRGLKLPEKPDVRVAIATWNWGKYMGADGAKNGVRVKISTLRRPDVSSVMTFAKLSGGYLTSVLARRESTLGGFDEAILLDPQGYVAEGSGENIFMVKEGKILTPPTGSILPGITRDSVMKLAKSLNLSVTETQITRNQLYLADEVFFSGTAVEVTAIREVDNLTIGTGKPGPVTQKLGDLFFKTARGGNPEFNQWLTSV